MARTAAGAELTQVHRRRQLELRAGVIAGVMALWPAFDLEDIDGSWPALEAGLLELIRARRRSSSELSIAYYRALRLVERVPGDVQPVIADDPPAELERATLRLLGPIFAKKAIARRRPRVAENTLTRLAGSTARQVLDGGRRTLTETIKADSRATGWRRITDSSPCKFCSSIADMGVVSSRVDFAAHDHCGCTAEPAFGEAPNPGSTQPFSSFLSDFEADVDRRRASGSSAGIAADVDGSRGALVRRS